MEPFLQNLTLGSGQVPTVATQITAGAANKARPMSFKFSNVGGAEETLILTLSRNGATPVRIARAVLAPNESFRLRAMPLNVTDSLLAVTTNPNAVDYLISFAGAGETYAEETYDDSGRLRTSPYLLEQLDATFG